MAQGHIFPKQQIEIVQVLEPKGYGTAGKELLPVMAKNLSLQEGDPLVGKSLKYTVFNQALQDHIKPLEPGARFLADLEERDRPDSQYGPDRNINQIYVDGKPVSQKQGFGGGGWKGRSLEDDLALERMKNRSIEGQSAMDQVGLVLTGKNPIENDDMGLDDETWNRILGKYWQAVEKSLDNFLAQPTKTQAAKATTPTTAKADQRPPGGPQKAATPATVSKDQPPNPDPVKHVGDLLTRANKIGVNAAQVAEFLGVEEVKNVGDLNKAWATIQTKAAEAGKELFG